jgi:hypothetical protein
MTFQGKNKKGNIPLFGGLKVFIVDFNDNIINEESDI